MKTTNPYIEDIESQRDRRVGNELLIDVNKKQKKAFSGM